MTNEQILTDFMRQHYTDEKLAALLAHAEDGKLAYYSCCCFVGIPTADHSLQGYGAALPLSHIDAAFRLPGAFEANIAYARLFDGRSSTRECVDNQRRAKLIPLIKAEMARRSALRSESPELAEVNV